MAKTMKVVVISDIHAHKYRSFNQDGRRLKNIIQLIEEVFELAHSNDDLIWCSGDLFNTMQQVQTETLVALTKVFTRMHDTYPKVKFLIISGNHDYATRNSIETPAVSAVQALAAVSDNVVLLDNRSWSRPGIVVHGIPYYDDPADLKAALGNTKIVSGNAYLLLHQTVGFGHDLVPDDIDPKDPLLTPFNMVFNGHIHTHEVLTDNFINVGTPLHRDAGDVGKEKGVLLFDTETDTFERIILDYPQYRRIDEGDPIPEEWANDYIMVDPKQIEVEVEEQEIKEKFDHTKQTRSEMLSNYVTIKTDESDEKTKAIRTYGEKLLSYAD